MLNVLLILPAQGLEEVYDEQGIALIAAFLREHGYKVILEVIRNIDELKLIKLFNVDIVGITAYHENLPFVFQISKEIKCFDKNILICLGGYSATYYAEEILDSCDEIDIIIEREGERTFLELCQKIEYKESYENQKGIYYREENGKTIYTGLNHIVEDLSEMPYSAKDIFEKNHMHLVEISTSRGCLNNCSFCYSHTYFDPTGNMRWRGRSVDNVFQEIVNVDRKYKVNKFYFNNASFEDSFPYKAFMINLCKRLIENKIEISFCVNFRAGFCKRCTEEEMILLKRAGLTGIFIGVEAFNESDLSLYNKHTNVNDNLQAIKFFQKFDIGLDIGFINFNPYSTYDSLYKNMYCLYQTGLLGSMIFLNRLRGYKGTPIYKKIEEDGLLINNNFLDYYCYRYIHKPVGELAGLLNNLFVDEYRTIPGSMHYFSMYHNQLVSHLRRVYRDNQTISNLLLDYDRKRQELLMESNDFCMIWYGEMLNLLQNNWNITDAEKIVLGNKVCEKMLVIEKKMRALYFGFTRQLITKDKQAASYLK